MGVDGVSGSKGVTGVKLKGVSLVSKKRKRTTQPPKIKKKQSRWCSYVTINVFVDITNLLGKNDSVHLFRESPFGYILDLLQVKVQPQIIRSLVNHLSNSRDDVFVFNLNGKALHFGLSEFRVITGFKCGGCMGFDHDPSSTSKLLSRYFPNAIDKVLKVYFIRVFN
ncbi:hypothetical protein RDI58_000785 [Solanum bulbocastanum]|uniref:Uncharacterized protein n=1 Tax=Solanum bulbocastanum TaxID=147425 RepID=A0AAN8UD13_SOLBU